jgi:hypothetical protein
MPQRVTDEPYTEEKRNRREATPIKRTEREGREAAKI